MPQQKYKKSAPVAELVDALDLGSSGWCRVGSSPIRRTERQKRKIRKSFSLFYFCNRLIFSLL